MTKEEAWRVKKLTDERRAAYSAAMREYWQTDAGETDAAEWAFLCGARWMRERAANVCESDPMDQLDCAAAIRALPLGDEP